MTKEEVISGLKKGDSLDIPAGLDGIKSSLASLVEKTSTDGKLDVRVVGGCVQTVYKDGNPIETFSADVIMGDVSLEGITKI